MQNMRHPDFCNICDNELAILSQYQKCSC